MGILIDNSGSMRDKRTAVNAAAMNLLKDSNRQDAAFIVNFNEHAYLDRALRPISSPSIADWRSIRVEPQRSMMPSPPRRMSWQRIRSFRSRCSLSCRTEQTTHRD